MDPEDTLSMNPYVILGVPTDAGTNDIEKKYIALALRYYSDKNADEGTQKQETVNFKTIQRAYEILSDGRHRARYDKAAELKRKQEFPADAKKLLENWKVSDYEAHDDEEAVLMSIPSREEATRKQRASMDDEVKERDQASEKLKERGRSRSSSRPPSTISKKKTLYAVPVEQLNLQTMYLPQGKIEVDIVAVHGLGAIPDITWVYSDTKVNWLCDKVMLPSSVPQARILRFGYDSLWLGKTPIRTSLSTIAYKLLLSLTMARNEDFCRPLIFIGHCFGGLVIQRALNLAKMQESAYPGVFHSSVGVVFLGTPHRGTKSFTQDSALFAAIAASSELSQSLEIGVLDSMKSENGALLDVTDDFVNLWSERKHMITCFYEQRPSKLGKIVERDDINEFIVDQTSATLDGHRKYGLELDHFSLNKFSGPKDSNYNQVRGEIVRFYETTLEIHRRFDRFSAYDMMNNAGVLTRTISKNRPQSRSAATQHRIEPAAHGSPHVSSMPEATNTTTALSTVLIESARTPAMKDNENEIKIEAVKELRKEETIRQNKLYEEELQQKRREQKRLAEFVYLERLKRNMVKYGIENSGAILSANPLPSDDDLTQQEIKDKDMWYKSVIKGELRDTLEGGQIDEILNDTGEMMVFDGVEMTFTKMARKWISTGTLNHYNIPWHFDQDDKSNIIIKRWVPDYERELLWDHSQALRAKRGRERQRHHRRSSDPKNKHEKRRKSHDDQVLYDSELENSRYNPRRSAPVIVRSTSSPPRDVSIDSTRSAPDYLEVTRRRRRSRTLSGSREDLPTKRQSGEFRRKKGEEASPSPLTVAERTMGTTIAVQTREKAKRRLSDIRQVRDLG